MIKHNEKNNIFVLETKTHIMFSELMKRDITAIFIGAINVITAIMNLPM